MLVTFSGYNASGKTTAIRDIETRLSAEGVRTRVIRFFTLDVSRWLRPRPPSPGKVTKESVPSVRSSERQPGGTAKAFRWYHFAKMAVMAAQISGLRLLHPNEVLLCSQYFYDNLVHFIPRGFWYQSAIRLTPQPDAAYLLMVDMHEYERRFIERIRQRHGVKLAELSATDRADINNVLERYREIRRDYRYLRTAQATTPADLDELWTEVRHLVEQRPRLRASEHRP